MNLKEVVQEIIDKVLRRKNNPKLLSDGNTHDRGQEFRGKYKENVGLINEQQEYSFEDCILEYIYQYRKQLSMGEEKDISYKSLTRMFSDSYEDKEENPNNQHKLIERIRKNNRYDGIGQRSSRGELIFYHIIPRTLESERITDEDPNTIKLYLNCERKNIAKLAEQVLRKLDKVSDCPFKMKFLAESPDNDRHRRYQRNEKIVIYTSSEIAKSRIVESITRLRTEKPELFSYKKTIPLMPKVGGFIGCTKQGKNYVTTPLYPIKGAMTYHEKLATIMEDCMISSIREVSARDLNLTRFADESYKEDPRIQLKAFGVMDLEQINQVVGMFKELLIKYCDKSGIDIDYNENSQNQQR